MMSNFIPHENSVVLASDTPSGEKMVLSVNLASLKFIKPLWKRAHYRASINWLTNYKPKSDASQLEKVRGYLEAFHHLCEIEEWIAAGTIFYMIINTPAKAELHNQLGLWGYYREVIELNKALLNKISPSLDRSFLTEIGGAYQQLGQHQQALEFFKQAREINGEVGARSFEAYSLHNIGNVCYSLGEVQQAIQLYQQALEITREIGDRQGEGHSLCALGNVYRSLRQIQEAILLLEQALEIAREWRSLV